MKFILLVLLTFTSIKSLSQFSQQGIGLIDTVSTDRSTIGQSVSLSSDGNTAIVGGPLNNNGQGASWVFVRSEGKWEQQAILVGTNGSADAHQGSSVAISKDGNTAIIGGFLDNSGRGAVWIFTRSGKTWTQQGEKLIGTGGSANSEQGWAVSISSDGNVAAVGGRRDNHDKGAVWIFTRTGKTWTQQGNKLVGTGSSADATQGHAVSLSADGNTAIIGAPSDNAAHGAAWIFTRTGATWLQRGEKLVGTGSSVYAFQGYSVALSHDGTTAIVGGINDNSGQGAIWVYKQSAGTWPQQGKKIVGTGGSNDAAQGCAVSVSADGNTAIVGGPGDNSGQGAAWVFKRTGETWSQHGEKLIGTGVSLNKVMLGTSASISSDAHTVIIGGPGHNSGKGVAWVFVNSSPLPVELISFNLSPKNEIVRLSWQTASELNNSGFEVERSGPASKPAMWEKIGFIAGAGTCDTIKYYFFSDKLKSPGRYSYRLKQVDFDGSYKYSKVLTCNFEVSGKFILYQNYPNPFNPSTVISYQLPAACLVTLKIYDILGNEIATLVNEFQQAGIKNFEFNIRNYNLSSGIYIYRIQTDSFRAEKKLLLIK